MIQKIKSFFLQSNNPSSFIEKIWHHLHRIISIGVLFFLSLPLIVIIPLSFTESNFLSYPIEQYSFKWYIELFNSPQWGKSILNSFIIGAVSTIFAMILGTLAAIGLNQTNFYGKKLLISILMMPMIVPLVVIGLGLYLFFSPIGLTETYTGMIIAHIILGSPFVLTSVTASLQVFDENLVRASLNLGAGHLKTFWSIKLPLIIHGVIAGALFAFATSFDEVVIALFLAGVDQVTLPRQMFTGIRDSITPVIAAIATLIMIFSTLWILCIELLRRKFSYK